MERSFPCKCGNGKIIAEWEEHDTWPSSNRCITWRFECDECAAQYVFYYNPRCCLVRQADADSHRAMIAAREAADSKVYEIAKKYKQKWIDYVLHLPTKVAKHHAVGARSSYGTFLKKARSTEWLTSEAKDEFRMQPKRCIDRLGITDLEISELNAEAASARKTADEFWINIDKTDVPFR
jgi:hypothetical protein